MFQRHGVFAAFLLAIALSSPAARAGSDGIAVQPGEWRVLTDGKTVYYSIEGEPYGREYYVPGTNRLYFEHTDGTCYEGEWRYAAPWFQFIFTFDGYVVGPDMFQHQRVGDSIYIVSDDPEQPSQHVDRIEVAPFSCDGDVTS